MANRHFNPEMLVILCLHLIPVFIPLLFDWVFIFTVSVYYISSILVDIVEGVKVSKQ